MALSGLPLMAHSPDGSLFAEQTLSTPSGLTRTDLLFNNVVIKLNEGKILYGLFIAAESEDLVIKVGKEEKRIPRTDIQRIALEAPSRHGALIAHGIILGIYAGSLLTPHDAYQSDAPFGYIQADSLLSWLWLGLEYATIGGGLGYLASLLWSSEAVFDFQGTSGKANQEWDKLRLYAAGASSRPSRMHVSIQGGKVFFGPRNTYERIFPGTMYGLGNSSFNLMRGIRITASASSWLDVGVAVCFLSEPNLWNSSDSDLDNLTTIYINLHETFSSTGYFAVAAVRYPPVSIKSLSLSAGVGLGAERLSFSLKTSSETLHNWQTASSWEKYVNARKTSLAALVFAEAAVCLGSGFSLGIAADYVFGPRQNFSAQPEALIPAHTIRFSNGSFGFSLGYNF
jgi:hypothetical protein